jgi:hypothetical protein
MSEETIGFITVSVLCSREADCRSFLDEVEDDIHALASNEKEIAPSTSSASESPKGWTEVFGLRFQSQALSQMDSFANDIVRIVRSHGIPNGCSIELGKREVVDSEERMYRRKVFAQRETNWQLQAGQALPTKTGEGIALPSRIKYLRELVNRYYQVGGNDVGRIFRSQTTPEDFIARLTETEAKKMRQAYERIVEKEDHRWLMEWLQEDCDVTVERAKVIYFFALLDRINEAGFVGDDYVELVDWDALI